jgi:hypothetical protein
MHNEYKTFIYVCLFFALYLPELKNSLNLAMLFGDKRITMDYQLSIQKIPKLS